MSRLLWLSDLHLDRIPVGLRVNAITRFIEASATRHVIVTGDMTNGKFLQRDMKWLSQAHPEHRFHVVMGNHDYYGSSFRDAHRVMGAASRDFTNLNWLSTGAITSLSEGVALVGHEGWFCATSGVSPWWTTFSLDAYRISELNWTRKQGRSHLLAAYRVMAERSVESLCSAVGQALKFHSHVVIATHFPPWPEATGNESWGYVGRRWVNYDTNMVLGHALEQIALENPEKQFTVLAGHTHKKVDIDIMSNMTCHVASRTVGERIFDSVIEV